MKKIISTLALAMAVLATSAQVNTVSNPYPKTINVTGSAEIELVPDEIYVQVDLREYEKKGSGKINLETIKKKFLEACKAAGISETDISIAAYQGNDRLYWINKKKKNPDMQAGISYMIKFSGTAKMDALVEKLDDEATQGFFVTKTSHSKIENYRKQLKIQAVKAAKEKATYLAEAIGEKTGVAISIQEPTEYFVTPQYKNMMANQLMREDQSASESDDIDFKKIKLKFEVNVVFALQ